MQRKLLFTVLIAALVCIQSVCGAAKYVFYFIGDGMGVNQVNLTEVYLSDLKGARGTGRLLMTQFPYGTLATTFSADNDVTDSAAAGTALATGKKTNNGYIGLLPDEQPIETIAEKARKAGKKVGVASTVPVNHATPAAFYGHRKDRNMYYEIAQDLLTSGFDFFGGAGFYNRDFLYDKQKAPDIFPQIEAAGYYIAKGYDDYKQNGGSHDKVVLVQNNWETAGDIPYAIDRTDKDLTLKQITEAAIATLTRNNKKGFFVMLEGGRIDWGGHANDAATVVQEVIDMDEAVATAYEFYKRHPKETLIVITADHETGGLTVGRGSLKPSLLKYQKRSKDGLSQLLSELVKAKDGKVSEDDIKEFLSVNLGFWKDVPVSGDNERKLKEAYDKTLAKQIEIEDKNLYSANPLIVSEAVKIFNDALRVGWASGSHSANYVPVFAIGAGAELFSGAMDNTDIPKKIIEAARY
jgi:alkaline phosphatase